MSFMIFSPFAYLDVHYCNLSRLFADLLKVHMFMCA